MMEHVHWFPGALHGEAQSPVCRGPRVTATWCPAVPSGAFPVLPGTGLGAMRSGSLLFLLDRST